MTTSESGPQSPYPALAEGMRAAAANAVLLWEAGAQALAAQAEAIQRMPLLDPGPGIDRYFELLQQATEANRQLAGQWAAAVRSMGEVLSRIGPDGTGIPVAVPVPPDGAASADDAPRAATGTRESPVATAATGEPAAELMVPEPVAPAVAAADGAEGVHDGAEVQVAPTGGSGAVPSSPRPPARSRARRSPGTTAPPTGRTDSGDSSSSPDTAPSGEADDSGADPRAAYVRLGKAAISARLAERGLPRTGTLAQLVNRLVAAEAAD
jgi:hypothetical protein